jgi:hypothetical protein
VNEAAVAGEEYLREGLAPACGEIEERVGMLRVASLALTGTTGNEDVTTDPGYSHTQQGPLCLIL